MAKELQSLINLAPSATKEIEGSLVWFTNNKVSPGTAWVSSHGNETNGGGSNNTWIVPSGVSEITFHIWGSGGVGAASHQCQQGLPAGAGAYAYKKVTSGFSAGDKYVMCLGQQCNSSCSTSAAATNELPGTASVSWSYNAVEGYYLKGCRGETTYVNGPGLTNFCAEGGNPGISVTCMIRGSFANCRGSTGTLCCNSLIKMCDLLGKDPDDSDGATYRRACYYGADDGARGVWACFQHGCCGCFEANCCNESGSTMWLAQPGGKWWMGTTSQGKYGWTFGNKWRNCTNTSFGMIGPHGTAERQHIAGATIANNNFDNGGAMIGVGGISAWTCGGTCCCGGYGGVGAVVIQYK